MANERLGIVEERQRDRARWGDYEYRAPILGMAKETAITVDLATGKRTIDPYVRKAITEVMKSEAIRRHIAGVVERAVISAIEAKEQMKANRNKQLRMMGADVQLIEVDIILNAVSAATGVTLGELRGPRRARAIAWPRFLACGLMSMLRPDLSYPAIGRVLGHKDHTTIMSAVKRFKAMREHPPFRDWLAHPTMVELLETK